MSTVMNATRALRTRIRRERSRHGRRRRAVSSLGALVLLLDLSLGLGACKRDERVTPPDTEQPAEGDRGGEAGPGPADWEAFNPGRAGPGGALEEEPEATRPPPQPVTSRGAAFKGVAAGNFEGAAEFLTPLVERKPDDLAARRALVHARVMTGDYAGAEALLRDLKLRKLNPEELKTAHGDIFGRIYEYFLTQFADQKAHDAGEFFTPISLVSLIAHVLDPERGTVLDPACGSGGMFVQSEKFVLEHGGRIGDIAIYGQESNYTTWRLAKMNLAVRGIDSDIRWNNEGSFHKDELRDLRFDHILANPPFNISDWGGDRLREDSRWQFGVPPVSNANYAWLQHIHWHLAPFGTAGVVLANGSMSSKQSGEGEIRKAMVEADAVDCMVALPGQLFYSTQIPACLWFLARDKSNGKRGKETLRDRRGEVLFIDARNMGALVDRTRRELTDEDIQKIADTYHAWRGEKEAGKYADIPGFCKSASLDCIRKHGHVLTPGRYVGAEAVEDEGEPFADKMQRLSAQWREQQQEAARLDAAIEVNLRELGYGG